MKTKYILITMGIVIFIALTITMIIVLGQVDKNEPKIESDNYVALYMKMQDSRTNELIDGKYFISPTNIEGKLSGDSATFIGDLPNVTLDIYCWNENHYKTLNQKNFTNLEIKENKSLISCKSDPIGDLEITHSGDLSNTENIIKINITTLKSYNQLSAVLEWTSGIINVEFDNNQIEETPSRFRGLVDKAITTGDNLKQETYELKLKVKTIEEKNSKDFLKITFYDKDLFYENGNFTYKSEEGGLDVGGQDFIYKINYAG